MVNKSILKMMFVVAQGVSLCAGQTIDIRGTVTDTAGAGVSGAMVMLESAGIATTTDSWGNFILTDNETGTRQGGLSGLLSAALPVAVLDRSIQVHVTNESSVTVAVYTISGRLVFRGRETFEAGTHSIPLPRKSSGMYYYRVSVGGVTYDFRGSSLCCFPGGVSSMTSHGAALPRVLSKKAEGGDPEHDVIAVTKGVCEYLDYRMHIQNFDTSGLVIRMLPCADTVRDADGNLYQAVRIGNQVWTTTNLRTTKYNDGTDISHVTDSSAWANLGTPAYCFYDNSTDTAYQAKWGALYNWHVVDPDNPKQVAPAGWRAPADADWNSLKEYLTDHGYAYQYDRSTIPPHAECCYDNLAKPLAAQADWAVRVDPMPPTPGYEMGRNNSTGFSAVPAGRRCYSGTFQSQGRECNMVSTGNATYIIYTYDTDVTQRNYTSKGYGFSIRLLRDQDPG